MHSFKDNAGRTWELRLTIATKITIREQTGVDLFKLRAKQFMALADFLDDDETFLRVVWLLVGDQAEEKGVSQEQLLAALTGAELAAANDAFVEELADFFSGKVGEALRLMLATGRELESRAGTEMAAVTPQQIVEKILAPTGTPTTSSETSGNVPASSESGPDSGPTGS